MRYYADDRKIYLNKDRRIVAGNRKTNSQKKKMLKFVLLFCAAVLGIYYYLIWRQPENIHTSTLPSKAFNISSSDNEKTEDLTMSYPEEIRELLEKNPEAEDFAKGYAKKDSYINQPIDLSKDYISGEVPLLMQWDRRWGYDSYGDDMIGIAGCGPTCLSMAYIYLTGDTDKNPRVMAEFAYENGYYTSAGTLWSLWKEGVSKLGLSGEELPLNEKMMKKCLDKGKVIICSMSPGDFTTEGHFILIRGYGENGFYVNDPNRHSTSEKTWSFDRLKKQIKCLWALSEK